MSVVIVIPARLDSSRLPQKPLADIFGKSLIMRVYERASLVKSADDVIVATDHQLIFDHVQNAGGKVILTSPNHVSGTDRVAEVANMIEADIIINVQGDEPLINPNQIEDLIRSFDDEKVCIATQKQLLDLHDDLLNYNIVKVVCNLKNEALYFSRQAIPAFRDLPYREWQSNYNYFRHIGLYGFRKNTLKEITSLPKSPLENTESLEQLRWLDNGYTIHCFETKYDSIGVDTEEDLVKVRKIFKMY